MADEQQLNNDGEALLTSDGSAAVDQGCCYAEACGFCDAGITPPAVTMKVTSNITACSGSPGGADATCLTDDTVPLTQTGAPCTYRGSYACNGETWVYTFVFTSSTTYEASIGYNDGITNLAIYCYQGTYTAGDCNTISETVNNDLVIGDCHGSHSCSATEVVGHGGACEVDTT